MTAGTSRAQPKARRTSRPMPRRMIAKIAMLAAAITALTARTPASWRYCMKKCRPTLDASTNKVASGLNGIFARNRCNSPPRPRSAAIRMIRPKPPTPLNARKTRTSLHDVVGDVREQPGQADEQQHVIDQNADQAVEHDRGCRLRHRQAKPADAPDAQGVAAKEGDEGLAEEHAFQRHAEGFRQLETGAEARNDQHQALGGEECLRERHDERGDHRHHGDRGQCLDQQPDVQLPANQPENQQRHADLQHQPKMAFRFRGGAIGSFAAHVVPPTGAGSAFVRPPDNSAQAAIERTAAQTRWKNIGAP